MKIKFYKSGYVRKPPAPGLDPNTFSGINGRKVRNGGANFIRRCHSAGVANDFFSSKKIGANTLLPRRFFVVYPTISGFKLISAVT
jgi:hypothetical protein